MNNLTIDTGAEATGLLSDNDAMYTTPKESFETAATQASSKASSISTDEEQPELPTFFERLFDGSGHTPPRKDDHVPKMSEAEVEERMQKVLWYDVSHLSDERYRKLAWIVGKGLDKQLGQYWLGAGVCVELILFKGCSIGKRFHAIYTTEGDVISEQSDQNLSFKSLAGRVHPQWIQPNCDASFTLYGSDDHPNIELFLRYQEEDFCFLHAPWLQDWYKILWGHPEVSADEIKFGHVSRYVRHCFSPKSLYKLIVGNTGGYSKSVAELLMCPPCQVRDLHAHTFDEIRYVLDQDICIEFDSGND